MSGYYRVPDFIFLLVNIVRVFACYKYFSICFQKKRVRPLAELAAYLAFLFATDMLFLTYDVQISDRFVDQIVVLIGLIALSFMYSHSILRNIGVSVGVYAAYRLCDILSPEYQPALFPNANFAFGVLLFFCHGTAM